jgi:cytochrome c oxidase cbb3-type subunit 3
VGDRPQEGHATADNTTGHVWDEDLREMNNPLPRWWVWLFIITIVFGLLYLVAYPGLGTYEGTLAWSSRAACCRNGQGRQGAGAAVRPLTPAMPPEQVAARTRRPWPLASACS